MGLVCSTTPATGYFIINSPHGDDDMMESPQLCIVPATIVSGDGVDPAGVPFQSTLFILNYLFPFPIGACFSLGSESNDQPSVNEILLHPGSPEQRKIML